MRFESSDPALDASAEVGGRATTVDAGRSEGARLRVPEGDLEATPWRSRKNRPPSPWGVGEALERSGLLVHRPALPGGHPETQRSPCFSPRRQGRSGLVRQG